LKGICILAEQGKSAFGRTAALFAGVGGLDLGLSKAGFPPELMADADAAAQAVLHARFPTAEITGDVSEITELAADIGLITAGFPCQDLSMAGTKQGLLGSKSSAVDHLFNLLTKTPTPRVLIENVYFMLHLDRGAAMNTLVKRIEALGYRWAYRVVDTRAFGLPQRRRRVFLLALRNDEDPRSILFADDAGALSEEEPSIDAAIGFYWTEGASGNGLTRGAIPPLKAGSAIGIASPPAVLFPDGRVVRPTIETAERLQGLPAGWTKPAEDAGFPRARWRLVGNAVSVPVAEWLGRRLTTPGTVQAEAVELGYEASWPIAAFGENGRRWRIAVSDRPCNVALPDLSLFDDTGWEALSTRALRGFTKRARASSLRYPEGFLPTLERRLLNSELH
jgi:DNA (cytosine-5)-methyltransferase 1